MLAFLSGVAVVGLLVVAGLVAGILRVAVTARARMSDAVGGVVERRMPRGGSAGRYGVEYGIEAAAGRMTAPLWLVVLILVGMAGLLTAVAWDGPGTLWPVALGVLAGLAVARLAVVAAARMGGLARRRRPSRPPGPVG